MFFLVQAVNNICFFVNLEIAKIGTKSKLYLLFVKEKLLFGLVFKMLKIVNIFGTNGLGCLMPVNPFWFEWLGLENACNYFVNRICWIWKDSNYVQNRL